jgi:N utilization substance protein B
MIGVPQSAGHRARTAARVTAVQALYEIEVGDGDSETILTNFVTQRWPWSGLNAALPPPDESYLSQLVRGVEAERPELERAIAETLATRLDQAHLEILLRCILLAGTYELRALTGTPTKVILNEYINIARAFFSGKEPGLINGVLDALARKYRAEPGTVEPG